MAVTKIVSGGQTGADRAALDWAISHGIEHGGWCPEGRLAEDGSIPERYNVTELPGAGYRARTKANVRDSDATLIMSIDPTLTGGSRQTAAFAKTLRKPWIHVHPQIDWRMVLRHFLDEHRITILNVAGPRAGTVPGISAFTTEVLDSLIPRELLALDSPPPDVTEKIARIFPRALSWYETMEADYYSRGCALSTREIMVARQLGVSKPESVRVVVLEAFPMPSDPELLIEAERYGFGSPLEAGRTNGYVIMLKPWVAQDAIVLTHELVHVSQLDRLGREAFVRRYLIEMEVLGYARSPLELEAFEKQGRAW